MKELTHTQISNTDLTREIGSPAVHGLAAADSPEWRLSDRVVCGAHVKFLVSAQGQRQVALTEGPFVHAPTSPF